MRDSRQTQSKTFLLLSGIHHNFTLCDNFADLLITSVAFCLSLGDASTVSTLVQGLKAVSWAPGISVVHIHHWSSWSQYHMH